MTTDMAAKSFVPQGLDPSEWGQLEPLYEALLNRTIDSADALRRWFADLSELEAFVDEFGSRRYIEHSAHTDDEEIERKYLHWVQQIEPKLRPIWSKLQRRFISHPDRGRIRGEGIGLMAKKWQCDVDLFRDENVPLLTRVTETAAEYSKVCGAMMVEFRGETYTLQQLARFLEETDCVTRREAWEAAERRRAEDRTTIGAQFDRLLDLRSQIAANADCESYRAYAWRSKKRFDYGPDDCAAFADAVEATCLPLVERLDEQRGRDLELARIRPWDLAVDPRRRPPLRPFAGDEMETFYDKTWQIFARIDGELAEQFASLAEHGNLDLDSRKGKQPGGYQCALERSRQPFIFMNAAGLQHDVETLLHEGGHAFHYLAASVEPIVYLRHAPLEFCEVASMSMELLAAEHLEVFYNEADAARARRAHMEGIVRLMPWVATIDAFQHWLYTNEGHDEEQRTEAWLGLRRRFASRHVNFDGYEEAQAYMWQRQGHLFGSPFYYIEYGIGQIGALQVWRHARRDPGRALADLRKAFALGGKRSLPELFEVAGIQFDFSCNTVEPLMREVADELERLPH